MKQAASPASKIPGPERRRARYDQEDLVEARPVHEVRVRVYVELAEVDLPRRTIPAQTKVCPSLRSKPAFSTSSRAPSASRYGKTPGKSDSPMCSRGNRSRSSKSTRRPSRAR
nr:hypothetical protein [Polyangium spumosum]